MDPEHACSPPHHILGLTIRSRTRIYVSYIIPNVLELLVYIVQIVADCAVSYQHFKSHQSDFGWGTLSLILVPPVVTCVLVLSSKAQWIKPKQNGTRVKFVCMQLLQMVLFPFFVIYRSAKLVFWSIEALFHDDDDEARMECLEKAEECSTCELYRLVQAYGQSAPQIILQLFHMLTQDLFRNFQTTNVQAISLVFSAIDLASITATYQRFESQRQVGRHYPWSTDEQKQESRLKLQKNKCLQEECLRKKRDSERTLNKFPESEKIMENFKARNQKNNADNPTIQGSSQNNADSQESLVQVSEPISHSVQVHGYDELDNDAGDEQTALLATHLTDDDKIKTKPLLKLNSEEIPTNLEEFDQVPNTPPPLPPKSTRFDDITDGPQLRSQTSTQSSNETNKRRSRAFSQLETFKDMLLINAQLYIKENVPRPPKMLIKRVEDSNNPGKTPPQSPQDVVDFFLPRPTKVVNGIQQDDFAAKSIAFFGWIAFVVMRMLSLSAFCVFFPKAFLIIMFVHYLIMLAALYLESRFQGKLNRTIFYFLLAYVYIYVLLEFRVKFKHIRVWFVCYFLLSMAENLTMTMIWYAREEFESWWFGFIFEGIIYSGILFVATIIVYYFILKPKDVILLVEDENAKQNQTNATATTTTDN
ncbi:uncharacterized protein LOC119600476 [Lucilia sericata]|uniref:uncharacterized protein LOC119600476 n=1 Tax=Lucilia sericata TaxID=13632 RepID=UPI0018A83DEC|nr:uncharacterized protein LOC119600476 [Lucilia sericata]